MSREQRQQKAAAWVASTFGTPALMSLHERCCRVVEEAIELAQAEGVEQHVIDMISARVFKRPPGNPWQELGGVGHCLLTYSAAKGVSADTAEEDEVNRVYDLPAERFRQKQQEKTALGISTPIDYSKEISNG